MKARALKKALDTNYLVHYRDSEVHIATPLGNTLMTLDTRTLTLNNVTDASDGGRATIRDPSLAAVWDNLQSFIDAGAISDYLFGEDNIEAVLPVFYEENGRVVQAVTDSWEWPCITSAGVLINEKSTFRSHAEAVAHTHTRLQDMVKSYRRQIYEGEKQLAQDRAQLRSAELKLESLERELGDVASFAD